MNEGANKRENSFVEILCQSKSVPRFDFESLLIFLGSEWNNKGKTGWWYMLFKDDIVLRLWTVDLKSGEKHLKTKDQGLLEVKQNII